MRISTETFFWSQAAGGAAADAARADLAPSFAELLEAGSSAGAVSGSRALGFSEVGIMGLHFAFGPDNEPSAYGGGVPSELGFTVPNAVTISATSTTTLAAIPVHGLQSDAAPQSSTPGTATAHLHRAAESSACATVGQSSLTSGLPETNDSTETASRPTSRFTHPTPESSKTSRLQLKLVSSNDGLAIIADGFGHDDDARRELETLTRDVAAEFGVTVSKLIVSSSSRGQK